MTDYFRLGVPDDRLRGMSVLALAHIGDGVYELMVRSWLCLHGGVTSRGLHSAAVRHVAAPAQARAAERISPVLTPEEETVLRRGRNAKVNSVPKNADVSQYHAATGVETLFGWLYLQGRTVRLNELFEIIMEGKDDAS